MRCASTRIRSGLLLFVLPALGAAPLIAADGLDDPGGYASYFFDLNTAATDLAYGCAVQADGKILLAGSATTDVEGGHKIAVARLLADGNPDPAFDGGDVVITLAGQVTGNNGQARTVAVDGQGRVLVGGTLHGTDFWTTDIGFVTRLLANGTKDETWDNGYFPGWFMDGGMTGVEAMGFDPTGRLWTTGPAQPGDTGQWRFQLMSNGGNDAGYGSINLAPHVANLLTTSPTAIAFQPDGKVLIGGWALRGAPANIAVMVIVRILGSTLQLDPAFGLGSGVVVIEDFQSSYLRSIALAPDLEIVIAGEYGPLNSEDISVIGLRPDGTTHWGDYVAFNLGGSNGDGFGGLNRMVVQSDGKIVVAAAAYTGNASNVVDVGVARLLPRMVGYDTSFGGNNTGKRSFDMPPIGPSDGNDTLKCLTLSGGKAVVAGSGHFNVQDWDFSLRRLTSDLIFADSFESGTTFFWSHAVP